MPPPALSARALQKTFRIARRAPVEAIADLSFEVRPGQFFSVVGPSGSGKTTLLRLIAGLAKPTSGEVWLRDKPIAGPIEDFGMVFQNPVLLPWRSTVDNVLLPIEMLGRPRRGARERAYELLEIVGLKGFEERRPAELSGGMQQRVALCRALIHEPTILLMDEPFGSLDEMTRESMNDYLLHLWEAEGKTVVFVTHHIPEAVYLSDVVAVLTPRPGRLAGLEEITLPRPRTPEMRYEPRFVEHVRRIQLMLRGRA